MPAPLCLSDCWDLQPIGAAGGGTAGLFVDGILQKAVVAMELQDLAPRAASADPVADGDPYTDPMPVDGSAIGVNAAVTDQTVLITLWDAKDTLHSKKISAATAHRARVFATAHGLRFHACLTAVPALFGDDFVSDVPFARLSAAATDPVGTGQLHGRLSAVAATPDHGWRDTQPRTLLFGVTSAEVGLFFAGYGYEQTLANGKIKILAVLGCTCREAADGTLVPYAHFARHQHKGKVDTVRYYPGLSKAVDKFYFAEAGRAARLALRDHAASLGPFSDRCVGAARAELACLQRSAEAAAAAARSAAVIAQMASSRLALLERYTDLPLSFPIHAAGADAARDTCCLCLSDFAVGPPQPWTRNFARSAADGTG